MASPHVPTETGADGPVERAAYRVPVALLLAAMILLGFLSRAATVKSPLLDHHAWRQADTAAIARNFYRERFNLLYPQVDWRADREDGYVETGLELFAFTVAALSFVAGDFYVESGRLLNCLLFVVSAILLNAFVRDRYGQATAVASVAAYAFGSPLALYMDRAFMNEALLICGTFAALRATQRYLAFGRPAALLTALAVTSLLAMIKLPWLIVWAPLAGLFVERYGLGLLARRWEPYAFMVVNLSCAWLWYSHAMQLGAASGLTVGMTDKLYDPAWVWSSLFPRRMLWRLFRDILGPIGLPMFLVGLAVAVRQRRWCEPLAVAGFIAYLVIVSRGNRAHDYYQLPLVPIGVVLAGTGFMGVVEWLRARRPAAVRPFVYGTAALLVVWTWGRSVSAHSWYEYDWQKVEICEAGKALLGPNDRVALFTGDENPELLFCMDRKGWRGLSDPQQVQFAQALGAAAVVVATSHPVHAWIEQAQLPMLAENAGYRLYRLIPAGASR